MSLDSSTAIMEPLCLGTTLVAGVIYITDSMHDISKNLAVDLPSYVGEIGKDVVEYGIPAVVCSCVTFIGIEGVKAIYRSNVSKEEFKNE